MSVDVRDIQSVALLLHDALRFTRRDLTERDREDIMEGLRLIYLADFTVEDERALFQRLLNHNWTTTAALTPEFVSALTAAQEPCGQWVGENTTYWPCSLAKDHAGPHSWHPRRREWELERQLASLDALVARLEQAEEALRERGADIFLALDGYQDGTLTASDALDRIGEAAERWPAPSLAARGVVGGTPE